MGRETTSKMQAISATKAKRLDLKPKQQAQQNRSLE